MNRLSLSLLLLLLFGVCISCSDSVSDLNTKDISLAVDNDNLEIRNRFSHSIYYFAVESGIAAQINWAPISSEQNRIKPNRTKQIPLEEIHTFEPGDEILFYYWSEKEPSNKNIKFQRIETH